MARKFLKSHLENCILYFLKDVKNFPCPTNQRIIWHITLCTLHNANCMFFKSKITRFRHRLCKNKNYSIFPLFWMITFLDKNENQKFNHLHIFQKSIQILIATTSTALGESLILYGQLVNFNFYDWVYQFGVGLKLSLPTKIPNFL